jgi:hypothetical protein
MYVSMHVYFALGPTGAAYIFNTFFLRKDKKIRRQYKGNVYTQSRRRFELLLASVFCGVNPPY